MQTRKNKRTFTVSRGIQSDYKARRLRHWALQVHDWDEYSRNNAFHRTSHERICGEVLSLRGTNKASLIDLGCGTGRFLHLLKERSETPWGKLVGIDFCSKMLNLARHLDTNYTPKVAWHHADLELPINQTAIYTFGGFDIATAVFLLDEVEDVVACFASAMFVLSPGGYFICGMLDADREKERHNLPSLSNEAITVSRSIVIRGHSVPSEFYRLVRAREYLCTAASSLGFLLHNDRTLRPLELETPRGGPALRIATWKKPDTRKGAA